MERRQVDSLSWRSDLSFVHFIYNCLRNLEKVKRRQALPTPGFLGFPCGSAGKESTCNVDDLDGFDPWVGKIT